MVITNLVQGKKDKERVNVFVDGQFMLALDKNTLVQAELFKGKEVTQQELDDLVHKDATSYLNRRLLAWCFKKPRSEKEIIDKVKEILDKRYMDVNLDREDVAESVVANLRAKGNTDEVYADWLAGERVKQGKYGRRKIVSDLILKGVPASLALQSATRALPDESQLVSEALQKKAGITSLREVSDYKQRAKLMRFLQSRGFSEF